MSLISALFISVAFAGIMGSKTPPIEPMVTAAPAEGTANNVSLEGTLWMLKTYADNEGKEIEVFPGSKITADFENARIAGSSGCNQYSGSYQTDGDNLSIGEIGLTMMYCAPEELMNQEREYLRALDNISSYKIMVNELLMANAEKQPILVYENSTTTVKVDLHQPWPGLRLQPFLAKKEISVAMQAAIIICLNSRQMTALYGLARWQLHVSSVPNPKGYGTRK